MIGNVLGYFENGYSYVKTALTTFWATFGKIGLLFTPTSGHTDNEVSPLFWYIIHNSLPLGPI